MKFRRGVGRPVFFSLLAVVLWFLAAGWAVPSLISRLYRSQDYAFLLPRHETFSLEQYLALWSRVEAAGLFLIVLLLGALLLREPRALLRKWKQIWFAPAPLGYLAVCRIAAVGLELILLISMRHYNLTRLEEIYRLPESLHSPLPLIRLFLGPWGAEFPPAYDISLTVYWITLIAGGLALLGLTTNFSLLVFAAGNSFLHALYYSFGNFHHSEALMIIFLWPLALSPCGRVWSLDRLLRDRFRTRPGNLDGGGLSSQFKETSIFARWPLLLGQCLFAMVYLDAAVRKLYSSGIDWMNGYTLQYYVLRDGLMKGSDFGVWIGSQFWVMHILSWVTMLFEATFFLVLFIPALAWLYIPTGVALHVGMCLTKVACFYRFIGLYVVFLPSLAAGLLVWRRRRAAAIHKSEQMKRESVARDLSLQ